MTDNDPFKIRALVPEFDAISADYAKASDRARAELRHRLDVPYGPAPRQRLDLFFPADTGGPAPVHLFVHGGYWRANDKENFVFPAKSIVAVGAIAAIVEYTLMPGARMAQLVDEVRAAARWVYEHAAEFGGDPGALSASGHSAGGHLAFYLAARGPHEPDFPSVPVRSLVLVSGLYNLRPISKSFLQPELHLTETEIAEWTPLTAVTRPGVVTVLAVGEKETEPFHRQASDLSAINRNRGRDMTVATAAGHDHMTIARDLGVPGSPMADLLVACIRRSRQAA
jgi:arylformamidase